MQDRNKSYLISFYLGITACFLTWSLLNCLTVVVAVDVDVHASSPDDVETHSGSQEITLEVDNETNAKDDKLKDLEIEDEGAGGTLTEGGELGSSNEEDGVPGSGNQNESDPTAGAATKVLENDGVPNFTSKEGSDGNKTPQVSGTPVKVGRVKVACWDFRTMKHPSEIVKEFLELNNSVQETSDVTNNSEETDESASSGEESEKVEVEQLSESQNVEDQVASESEASTNVDEIPAEESVGAFDPDGKVYNRTVEIVNMTTLLHDVLYSNHMLKDRGTPSNCSIVMFYATWCPFSAKAAPHFNALPRAYIPLRVAAIDSSKYKNVNTYFGILSVPSVVLFHNGKIIAKFNDTSFTLNKFAEFIEYFTDLKQEERMNVTTKDFEGPLSSTPIKEIDWYLYVAWVFLIGCFFHYVTKSSIWKRAVDYVGTVWREAQAQHEHMD